MKIKFSFFVIFIVLFFLDFLFTEEPKKVIKITKLTGNIYKLDHNFNRKSIETGKIDRRDYRG
jgi:hypothetical protein